MAFFMTCLVVYDVFASLQYWLNSNYFASNNKAICIHPSLSLSLLVAKYNPLLINSRQLSNSFVYSNSHTNNVHKTPITWTLRSRTPRYEKVFFFLLPKFMKMTKFMSTNVTHPLDLDAFKNRAFESYSNQCDVQSVDDVDYVPCWFIWAL